ncbi:nucleolar protein 12 [Drepanopeziza brunnea f. sp. 'multigermtubi' MB_m1]|uniref:Nucleolar protein 12 n=1 Tax=Marssonina brunnea f. sp. multigermtubi (strain MB_m1) TaxID=1072389 RepID=K1WVC2_MARBU|nr:nucleolar protein 12 [Drepanopeziza brunnea f. sp. 'multigermtubi' MB_m1]EKD12598.1 nucleolar protein 12 [Drepanopeziza brunnea f. sp. 'multigermtubi' MB_m1]
MGKRSRKDGEASENIEKKKEEKSSRKSKSNKSLPVEAVLDPSLALLFATSAGPVKPPPKSRYQEPPPPRKQKIVEEELEREEGEAESEGDDEDLSSVDGDLDDVDVGDFSESENEAQVGVELEKIIEASIAKPERKRKRKAEEEDLEGKYMQKLAKEEEKEEAERKAERRLKRQRTMATQDQDMSEESEDLDSDSEKDDGSDSDSVEKSARTAPADVPLHESLAPSKDAVELEKASRTVFLANVSTLAMTDKAAKKTLLGHMGSFLSSLAPLAGKPEHKIESLRFRSTAYAGTALPKKAAFAKKDLMAATTKSTNAYVVYSTAFAAREAVKKLNGTMVLDRHLRVDGVAHPAKTDHRRCVFVGNLGFVDDESMMEQGGDNERKRSKIPSDIEEGLWRQFGKVGTVESVRVVRDEKTRVGKGFAYVQFEDANSVEAALLFNEKKYPPMLPRVLRVVRAKAVRKTALASAASRPDPRKGKVSSKPRIYQPKTSAELSSLKGRAGKLLGKAGAAQFRNAASGANGTVMGKKGDGKAVVGISKTPESIVFEGYRASSKNGKPKGLKMGGEKKGKGKPKGRSSARASSWRKSGGKKVS